MSRTALRANAGLLGILIAAYALTLFATGGLDFPLEKDERHFWATTLDFVRRLPTGIAVLGDYGELTTPLSFVLWAAVEGIFHGGPPGARGVVLLCSFALAVAIGWRRPEDDRTRVLCVVGLLACPYFLPLSVRIYTDLVATLFVVLGLRWHGQRWFTWSALAFVLAIATRQYMVAFPVALAVHASWHWLRDRSLPLRAALLPALAAGSLLGWVAVFGGLVPARAFAEHPTPVVAWFHIQPAHGLYFLSTLGAYFVIPETILLRRGSLLRACATRHAALGAVALLLAFAVATPAFPDHHAGALNRALYLIVPWETARLALLLGLAWLVWVRFAGPGLGGLIVATNLVILLKTWIPWDKYSLPVVAALWCLVSLRGSERCAPGIAPTLPEDSLVTPQSRRLP